MFSVSYYYNRRAIMFVLDAVGSLGMETPLTPFAGALHDVKYLLRAFIVYTDLLSRRVR